MSKVNDQKQRRRSQLEHEYWLAQQGLDKVIVLTIIVCLVAMATLGGALYAFVSRGEGFLSGYQLVLIFLILVGALIVYLSFIFGRVATLKARISDTERDIELSVGEDVRSKPKRN